MIISLSVLIGIVAGPAIMTALVWIVVVLAAALGWL